MSETLIHGGPILTMDSTRPAAEAVLIRGSTIAAVGNRSEVRQEASGTTREIDLHGRALVPGFNDSHTHFAIAGLAQTSVDLAGLSKSQILESIAARSEGMPKGQVLVAENWDYPACPDPHISDLDRVLPDRPAYLAQFSGHAAWVNSAFLRRARIKPSTPDWNLGGVERDSHGNPTGILREPANAPGVARFYIGRFLNRTLVDDGLDRANEIYSAHGITSIQDNTWFPWHLGWLRSRAARGLQSVRMTCWSYGKIGFAWRWFESKRFDPEWCALGPRKFFLDGAFSSRTALLCEPYSDDPSTSGSGLHVDEIERFLTRATRAGRQTASHSIGDAATHRFAVAAGRVAQRFPHLRDQRHRIEHAQLVQRGDFARIADLGLIIAAQPHAAGTPQKDLALIGEERLGRAYPYRSILDAGIPLAFGSDYPGEATFDPLLGVHLAANLPSGEAITPYEALYAYTAGSAFAEFREHDKGKIKESFLADLAILSDDPTAVDRSAIRGISVEQTLLGGRTTYERVRSDDAISSAAP